LSSRGKGIGIDEAAGGGIVITGLEVISPGLIGVGVAMRAKKRCFQAAGNGTKNRTIG